MPEYVNQYGSKDFNERLSYLFQDNYNDKKLFYNTDFIFIAVL